MLAGVLFVWAFVAQFMGAHNVIATPGGQIAVRADRLKLRAQNHEAGRLCATVRTIEYQGTHHQVTLAAPGDGDITAILNDAEFDAVAPRLTGALQQIKVMLIRIDDDGAGSFARRIADVGGAPNRIDISRRAHGGRAAGEPQYRGARCSPEECAA